MLYHRCSPFLDHVVRAASTDPSIKPGGGWTSCGPGPLQPGPAGPLLPRTCARTPRNPAAGRQAGSGSRPLTGSGGLGQTTVASATNFAPGDGDSDTQGEKALTPLFPEIPEE